MVKPNIGISDANLKKITQSLSEVLADAVMLYTKTRKFHWNVAGESFMEYHKLFESQYKKLEVAIDEVAERINKLGSPTPGTTSEFTKLTQVKETPGKNPDSTGMVKELLNDHENIIRSLRQKIDECDDKLKDKGTADFLTGIMEEHETIAWTLRRYLN
ncbi:MAG: DNA starvation/stationary phase protection protein [Pedobacter sp.]|nr:MAG: DNA starvation/stationary phase protection protein [Pedobacter sp.]